MISGFATEVSQNKRNQEQFNYDGTVEQSVIKKAKVIESAPSRVLHVRNLPPDCAEQEITSIALPFGPVERVLLLKGKNQAFVQMQQVQDATGLVQYYSTVQANIRGKPCYFQYSNRTEITTPQEEETPNHILLVSVLNLVYPVSIDILHTVFSKYGAIRKIIIFSKKGFQSLVEFSDKSSAIAAKQGLDGQNIYSGCCTLRIQYSNFTNLNVKFNNDKSRDFTDNSLPSGMESPSSSLSPYPSGVLSQASNPSALVGLFSEGASGWSGGPIYPGHALPFGGGGAVGGVVGNVSPVGSLGGVVGGSSFSHKVMSHSALTPSGSASTVLIVNNLDPQQMNVDLLFRLFGVYGDVLRVKILYNKPDTALIMFSNPLGAETALTHLNGVVVHSKSLTVNFSKHNVVSLPREGQEGSHLTKDFTGSSLHRYKLAGSKNFQHICPPGPVLHVSNLPTGIAQEEVVAVFAKHGTVTNFKFFTKDPRMALVEMASTTEAVEALMHVHDFRFGEHNVRVSFSKSSI